MSTSLLRWLSGLVAWAIALVGTLSIANWPGHWGHGICGPWGCGPPLHALVTCHSAWVVVFLPPTIWMRRRCSVQRCQQVAWMLLSVGIVGLLTLAARESTDWLAHADDLHRRYLPQRLGFALVTLVDVPLMQVVLAGVALLAKRKFARRDSKPFVSCPRSNEMAEGQGPRGK